MSISYKKLFTLMQNRGIKKANLRNEYHINQKVISSLAHERSVTVSSIMHLCEILDCQPGDIKEYNKSSTTQAA